MSYYPNPKLNQLTSAIIELMPPVGDFFAKDISIDHHARRLSRFTAPTIHLERQRHFKHLLQQKIQRLFTPEERQRIHLNWEAPLQAGVVDHHGILNHPVLAGVNITSHYWRLFDHEQQGDILTFATGNVSLNNHFHRRGFQFSGQKVNLFSKSEKNQLVYATPTTDWNIIARLHASHRWSQLPAADQQFFLDFQNEINAIDFSGCHSIGDQITKINFYLWPRLFSNELRGNCQFDLH